MTRTSEELRFEIITLRNRGLSLRRTASQLETTIKTVRYWDKIWRTEHRLSTRQSTGRKRILTNEHIEFINAQTKLNRQLSCSSLQRQFLHRFPEYPVSKQTIYNVRKEQGYQYLPPRTRTDLTRNQMIRRKEFARIHLNNDTDWNRVLFSDESWFFLDSTTGHIWRKRGEQCGISP